MISGGSGHEGLRGSSTLRFRPAVQVTAGEGVHGMQLIGIEIGGTKLQLVVGTASGQIQLRRRIAVDRAGGGAGIRAQIAAALPELLATQQPAAVGVGFGGPVDWRTGGIECSHQIAGWAGFPLGEWLHGLTGLPVVVDNDANVAALGEARFGAGVGANPVFYITMGSGSGGGLVVNGALYHGAKPGETEIGHVRLDRQGTKFEDCCSGWAVDRRLQAAARAHPKSILAGLLPISEGGEARQLAPALAAGCPVADRLLMEVADDIAFGLSHVVHLLHPEIIVLGGGLSLVGEPLRNAVSRSLPRYVMDSFQPGPRIVLAGCGEDSVPVGALALADALNAGRL